MDLDPFDRRFPATFGRAVVAGELGTKDRLFRGGGEEEERKEGSKGRSKGQTISKDDARNSACPSFSDNPSIEDKNNEIRGGKFGRNSLMIAVGRMDSKSVKP